ncbi:MAG TPA: hypothetical protein VKX16_00845 [Chloroflexota bacterium]|nr:hypothetical protein [Chloroflexota bacterium]
MTAPHASDIINGYLARLEAEAADLPRVERRDLIDGVREHIAEARAELSNESDSDLLNLLDRLGNPAGLAQEERNHLGMQAPEAPRAGLLEIGALILTPLIWPVGVILLWASSAWNARDKLIGTLVPPGGLFTSLLVFSYAAVGRTQACAGGYRNGQQIATTCSGGLQGISGVIAFLLIVAIAVSPILTGIYMAIRLRRGTRSLGAGIPA